MAGYRVGLSLYPLLMFHLCKSIDFGSKKKKEKEKRIMEKERKKEWLISRLGDYSNRPNLRCVTSAPVYTSKRRLPSATLSPLAYLLLHNFFILNSVPTSEDGLFWSKDFLVFKNDKCNLVKVLGLFFFFHN